MIIMPYNNDGCSSCLFYDFETTGLNPFHDEIIEYTFLGVAWGSISSLIHPKKMLSEKITKITNITNDMLKDKPFIEDKIDEIYDFIVDYYNNRCNIDVPYIYLIAHNNNSFDMFFFKRIFKLSKDPSKVEFINKHIRFIDTLHLAKLVLPSMKSLKLKTLCKIYNIKEGNHRSYEDTYALIFVYQKLLDEYTQYNNKYTFYTLFNNPHIVHTILYN